MLRELQKERLGSCRRGQLLEEEVQVRKACASFGVMLRAGMESGAGEGLLTCGKGNDLLPLPARGLNSALAGRKLRPPPHLGLIFP